MKEDKDAYRQSSTNVRLDEIELANLEAYGPKAYLAATSSTTGVVRNISEVSEIENQGSSQKRNR